MNLKERSREELLLEIENLHGRLSEAEETLRAIRSGEIDALVVSGARGEQVFTLKGAEKPYRILIEQMEEGAAMLDAHNSILYCNSGFARILKEPLEKIIGTSIVRYILPACLADFEELLNFGMQESIHGEISFMAGDGTYVPVYFSINSLNIDGIAAINLIAMDLTERKRAENDLRNARDELEIRVNERTEELVNANEMLQAEIIERREAEKALRKSTTKYRLLTESILDTFTAIDHNLRFTYWNRAAEELVGISADEALGKTVVEIFGDNEITRRALGYYLECVKTRQPIRYETGNFIRGRKYDLEIRLYPTDDGVSIIGRDITEKKMAEEALLKAHDELELRIQERTAQLKESLEEKKILLREIHHRVKNNMQVISGLLMLQEEFSNDEKVSGIIKESQNRIDSMALIHEKLYRSESVSKIDIKEYVDDLASGLFESYGITESKVSLNVNAENISMGIEAAIPCGLIINELVSNSLKHAFPAGKKGEIEISLRPIGDDIIELLARDNGVGIPKGIDFRKTESLGLHIVNILVENQLHGEITMNKNKGTEFRIRFREVK
ncbi:MAG: PAS domain S-box protein [Candidatus Methanoperedens sp.]|nr:PAS domain S-box protein [Candidatus Methanoperedens sp.]MCE8425171.1 PAS domain S-box protein [Candidatus Methanoperedens sp.]MCE8429310.1 PAS domain S-box protein [Candidatus Methanoperedens sp.]